MESRRPLMPPTTLCIVARSMTCLSERERVARSDDRSGGRSGGKSWGAVLLSWVVGAAVGVGALGSVAGCDELDARNRIRQGNRLFRETRFVDAVAEYQYALLKVDHPIVHYNLGLAYSKVFKPGFQGP